MKTPCIATSWRLWNTGRFDDIRIEREPGKEGWIIRFVVVERPVIRSINYVGNKSMTQSDILDRFKERKVGLVVESQYDPNKIQRARNVLLDMLAERGHQYAKVDAQVQRVPPSSLEVTFKIDEGPKVKVGKIAIEGNNNLQQPGCDSRHEELRTPSAFRIPSSSRICSPKPTIPPSSTKTRAASRCSTRNTDISRRT